MSVDVSSREEIRTTAATNITTPTSSKTKLDSLVDDIDGKDNIIDELGNSW